MKAFLQKSSLFALLIILITACSGSDSGSTATFKLTVATDGPGTGTVISVPAGIDCGTDCSESYTENTVVSLTASPADGSSFAGWSGACSGTDSCSVTMDAATSVTATFDTKVYSLSVTLSGTGTGTGTVTSAPAGIDCGTDCSESYAENTTVILTASPAVGSTFTGWSGACSGTDSCSVTMDAATSVTATFSDSGTAATFDLTVTTDGPGTGTVTSAPAGIDCGTDCSESYTENTVVSLTASPAAGSLFTGWSGACSATDSCAVTMDAAKSVTATFVEYNVDCSSYAAYSSGLDPIVRSSGTASTTVIMMHGKAAMPDDVYLLPFYDELSVAGYDVVAPFMPWRRLDWDGSMCEAMNYIDELAAQEAIKGNAVIIAGHSMGGAHALIYAATLPAAAVKAIITLAPGHFPQLELPLLTVFDPITAARITSSIAKAEDMVANGFGDQLDTFDTLIPDLNNPLLQISATANDYLSYHALYQYPDINDVLPSIKLPVLWLAGAEDALTDFYDMPALFSRITSPNSIYQEVLGDHLGMVSNSAAAIVLWISSLGL